MHNGYLWFCVRCRGHKLPGNQNNGLKVAAGIMESEGWWLTPLGLAPYPTIDSLMSVNYCTSTSVCHWRFFLYIVSLKRLFYFQRLADAKSV